MIDAELVESGGNINKLNKSNLFLLDTDGTEQATSGFLQEVESYICEHLYQEGFCSLEDVIRSKINKSPFRRCIVKGNG